MAESGEWTVIVINIQTIPGYYEKERLRVIRVQVINGEVFESSFDIALDHLPSTLLEQKIRDVKIIEQDTKIYVLILYYNGVIVLIDFNEQLIEEELFQEEASEYSSKIVSFLFAVIAFVYFSFGRNYFFQPRNRNG